MPQPAASTDPPQTIESDDPFVLQTGTWTAVNTSNASGGSYLYASSSSDTLTLDFYGTSIEVIYVEDPAFGSFTVEIDNNAVRTVTATGTSTVFDVRSVFEYLDDGPHTLRIMGIQGTVAIDAFYSVPLPLPDLVSLFVEDFTTGELPGWMENAYGLDAFVLPSGNDYALQLNNSYGRFHGLGGIDDIVIRSAVKIESGSAVFDINQSAAGGYQLVIEADGTLTLNRSTMTLGTASLAAFGSSQWFTLEWQHIEGRLKVFIDDILVIVVHDSNPLQYGTFEVNNDAADKVFWIDDFEVFLTQAEFDEMFGSPSSTPTPPPPTTTPTPTATPPPGGVPESTQNSGQILYKCSSTSTTRCIKNVETGAVSSLPLGNKVVHYADWMPSGDEIIYVHSIQGMCTDPLRRSYFFGRIIKVGDTWQDQGDFARPPVQSTFNGCDYTASISGGMDVSPDGTKVAFSVSFDGANISSAIWILDLNSCSQNNCDSTPLTADSNLATNDWDPTWSPDGTMIAFDSNRAGSYRIHTVSASGGSITPIPYPGGGYGNPDWSSDNTLAVAWTSVVITDFWTYQRRVDIIGLDGSIIASLPQTFSESTSNTLPVPFPSWSPDASQFVYENFSSLYIYDLATDTQTTFAGGSLPRWWGDPCPSGQQESSCQQQPVVGYVSCKSPDVLWGPVEDDGVSFQVGPSGNWVDEDYRYIPPGEAFVILGGTDSTTTGGIPYDWIEISYTLPNHTEPSIGWIVERITDDPTSPPFIIRSNQSDCPPNTVLEEPDTPITTPHNLYDLTLTAADIATTRRLDELAGWLIELPNVQSQLQADCGWYGFSPYKLQNPGLDSEGEPRPPMSIEGVQPEDWDPNAFPIFEDIYFAFHRYEFLNTCGQFILNTAVAEEQNQYDNQIVTFAMRHRVPPFLLKVLLLQESQMVPTASNAIPAYGLGQLTQSPIKDFIDNEFSFLAYSGIDIEVTVTDDDATEYIYEDARSVLPYFDGCEGNVGTECCPLEIVPHGGCVNPYLNLNDREISANISIAAWYLSFIFNEHLDYMPDRITDYSSATNLTTWWNSMQGNLAELSIIRWQYTLAAYNAGIGQVSYGLQPTVTPAGLLAAENIGVTDFEWCNTYTYMPLETQIYVRNINNGTPGWPDAPTGCVLTDWSQVQP